MAVDPGTRRFGIAILEGEKLIWYRVKYFHGRCELPDRRKNILSYLTKLLQKFEPEVLAVEEPFYTQAKESEYITALSEDIKTWGKWKGLEVYGYLPTTVIAYFCRDRQTRESLKEFLVQQYPVLTRYHVLIPWDDKHWFRLFDAVGLGLMCSRKLAR